ncbi:hypothetical protein L5515_016386 [Caenorhabditis briggsae]|uniref:Uncharacterized protein n=1 Tax=Caenorhabditis briggsae TaxID=6238 RepID=A0AAE9FCP3_CAEBR|nr:hypothetical protein L5515_016386 [Caenorhabditis briggsae]
MFRWMRNRNKPKMKTHWDLYPDLKLLKSVGKRRTISFMFFSYLFLFTAAETIGPWNFILAAQVFMTFVIVPSALVFDHGINNLKGILLMPMVTLTMCALSLVVMLFIFMTKAIFLVPPFHVLLLAYNICIFAIAALLTVMMTKCLDTLWQGYHLIGSVCKHPELVKNLKNNVPLVQEPEVVRNQRPNVRQLILDRVRRR